MAIQSRRLSHLMDIVDEKFIILVINVGQRKEIYMK